MDNSKAQNGSKPQTLKVWTLNPQERVSWGPHDPKIFKPHFFAKEITKYLDLNDDIIREIDFLADRLSDKLESALMYYQLINADDFKDKNISQQRTIYEGLYSNLWSYYKGRVQNFLAQMGWDLALFFCKEQNFQKEADRFIGVFPEHEDVVNMARFHRDAWQADFANSRNKSEHSGDYRDGTKTYESKEDAKRLFAQVCRTAETLTAYFSSYKLKPSWNIVELNQSVTIFDEEQRYTIEHELQTRQREKSQEQNT